MWGRFLRDASASAAVEMALVLPFLLVLMFGSMELGNYFYSEHILVKAVRDGARFASRESFSEYTCPNTIVSTVSDDTKNVTRTGTIDASGSVRLTGWTDNSTITVSMTCDTSGTYGSFFDGLGGVPVVTVSASVPYSSLFSGLGFGSIGLTLNAESQAAVLGG